MPFEELANRRRADGQWLCHRGRRPAATACGKAWAAMARAMTDLAPGAPALLVTHGVGQLAMLPRYG